MSECVSTLLIPSEYRAVISVFNSDWLCAVMPHYLIIQTTADWMLKDQSLEIHDEAEVILLIGGVMSSHLSSLIGPQ